MPSTDTKSSSSFFYEVETTKQSWCIRWESDRNDPTLKGRCITTLLRIRFGNFSNHGYRNYLNSTIKEWARGDSNQVKTLFVLLCASIMYNIILRLLTSSIWHPALCRARFTNTESLPMCDSTGVWFQTRGLKVRYTIHLYYRVINRSGAFHRFHLHPYPSGGYWLNI